MTSERPRMFPIQTERGAKPHPLSIPWSVAELAYSVYAGKYGRDQSMEVLAQRGGFGPSEMDLFLPGWRDRCDELLRLREAAQSALLLLDDRGLGGCDELGDFYAERVDTEAAKLRAALEAT